MKIRNKNDQDLWTLSELLKSEPVQNSILGAVKQTLGSEKFSPKFFLRFQDGFRQSIDEIQDEAIQEKSALHKNNTFKIKKLLT